MTKKVTHSNEFSTFSLNYSLLLLINLRSYKIDSSSLFTHSTFCSLNLLNSITCENYVSVKKKQKQTNIKNRKIWKAN